MQEDMQGLATKETLARDFKAKKTSFLLGRVHPDHGSNHFAGVNDDRHVFVMAASRAGKGTSLIIPNLLHWRGGVFCIDPKGENASITAARRGTEDMRKRTASRCQKVLGQPCQKVAILDPLQIVRGAAKAYRVDYDPMTDIEKGTDYEEGQIQALAESIVLSEDGNGKHFTDSAETILAGLIEAVLYNEPPASRSLAKCRAVFLRGLKPPMVFDKEAGEYAPKPEKVGKETVETYLRRAVDEHAPDAGLAENALTIIEGAGDDEAGSFTTTLSRQLRFMGNPRMKRHLRKSEFSLAKAVQENWSVYVCIPPSRLARFSRWTRALVQVAFAAKMDERHTHKGERNLFILDEFAALGKVQPIEESMAYMAGYGIKLCPIIQNLGQVKEHYPKNWETFFSNSGVVIAWGLNDLESLKYVSDRMGNVMAWETSYSSGQKQQGGLLRRITGYSDNRSTALHERPVRRVNEIHEDGSREGRLNQDGTRDAPRSFILPASSAPFIVQRVNYFDDPNHAGLYDSEDDIRAWEEKHGGKI